MLQTVLGGGGGEMCVCLCVGREGGGAGGGGGERYFRDLWLGFLKVCDLWKGWK